MKKLFILIMALSVAFTSVDAFNKKKKKSVEVVVEKVLTNEIDSMSYALGMNVGADFLKNIANIPGGKSNIDLLVKGFSASMKGDSTLLAKEFAAEFFNQYISREQAKEIESKKNADKEFLSVNKTKSDVIETTSGLQYKIITPADGMKPTAQDTVVVHYEGTLIDGTKFDSSVDRGEPLEFPLNQVIKGWTEGVQLMSIGAKYRFFVPYTLGYGEKGAGKVIPPFATLIFDVELLDIKPFNGSSSFLNDIQPLK